MRPTIPLWIKLACTGFAAVLVPVYWRYHGPVNFLWACDIALLVTVVALWRESRLLASTMAVAVLVPELAWNLDFLTRLVTGRDLVGLDATGYMFSDRLPAPVRALSLFHVWLPWLLLWMLHRLGFDRRAAAVATAACWVVLPVSYCCTEPSRNINWVFGLGGTPWAGLPGPVYLGLMLLLLPLCLYLPTQWLLARVYARS